MLPEFPPRGVTLREQRFVQTDDGADISIRIAGAGPPVLLIHGITGDADDWGFVAQPLLAAGRQVITMEQRGHGESTVGSEGFSAARLGRDLGQVLAALDLRNVVVAGHSMGGIATLSWAADNLGALEERVRGLCLVSTLASTTSLRQRVGSLALKIDWRLGARLRIVGRLFARIGVFGRNPDPVLVDHVLSKGAAFPLRVRRAAIDGLRHYNVRREVPQMLIPARVVVGQRDLVTPIGLSRFLADALPSAALRIDPDAGHLIIWENPNLVAHEILAL